MRATLLPEFLLSFARPFRPRRAIEQYQTAALRRLVAHAHDRVPFYRRSFERHGIARRGVRVLEDLLRLPPVSRRELQETPIGDRLADGIDLERCHVYETSGSSGEPLRIVRTPHEDARIFGRRLRAQIFSGLRPWHLRVNIGSPRKLFRWHRIGTFRIHTLENRPPYDDLLERLAAMRPDVLMVSPETLGVLNEQVSSGPRLSGLRRIFSGGNQLPLGTRRRAEAAFAVPLIDFYGTTECSLVAWECWRCGRYHTSDDSVIVEVVRPDGSWAAPGEEGEVLLTVLHSLAMPFIRLRLGDVARRPAEPSGCPVGFGEIEVIEGRIIDYLRLPHGRRVAPFRILNAIDEIEALRRWDVIQHSETRFELRFEPLPGSDANAVEREIRTRCDQLFPADVEVVLTSWRFGDEGAGGQKLRFVQGMGA